MKPYKIIALLALGIVMAIYFMNVIQDNQLEENSNSTDSIKRDDAVNPIQPNDAYWSPSPSDSFQWQLADYPIDTTIDTDVYDIDYFDTPKTTIDLLHDSGRKVICYVNVGAWEDYRDDADEFPTETLGNDYEGWEGEKWLDISNYELFSSIIEKRFDLAKQKGCDAIEPDNIEGYQEETGFNLSYDDQLEFNLWLSQMVHERDMSIGLKNDPEQVTDLLEYYDWALLEDCHVWDFCSQFTLFSESGKAVFQIEYTDEGVKLEDFCSASNRNGFIGILKTRDLNNWVKFCE